MFEPRSVVIFFALQFSITITITITDRGKIENDDRQPLFLTPYIESGNISAAQDAARVKPFVGNVNSYSGLLTVDSRFNSNLFFWFFPRNNSSWLNSPLVLWLQGGPGASSLYGLFEEIGPYVFKRDDDLLPRERYYSWTTEANLLFIDNPVGTGFSYTESENGYAENQTTVAENLYEAIRQFYLLFPALHKNRFIIAGESYAGKYIPNLALTIHNNNNNNKDKHEPINLYGLFIGNPFIEGEHMLHYNDYLYGIGLLDRRGKQIIAKEEELVKSLIKSGRWLEAADKFGKIFFEGLGPSLFQNLTGFNQHYNFLFEKTKPLRYSWFVQQSSIRQAIHVGQLTWNKGRTVYDHLENDLLKSAKPVYEQLLPYYKILIYVGQLDIICPFNLVENVLRHLNWKYAVDYDRADNRLLRVDQYLAGYYKTVDKLTTVLIRNSGHMVPKDKPQWARVLLRRFLSGEF